MSKINLKIDLMDALGDDVTGFIPVVADEKELLDDSAKMPDTVPILPLRNTVLFPGVIIPVSIGRAKSLQLLQEANKRGDQIGCVAQKEMETEDPVLDDLYKVGTLASVVKMLEMPDGSQSTDLIKIKIGRAHV